MSASVIMHRWTKAKCTKIRF